MGRKKFDLEDRLIKFSCLYIEICELLPNTRTANNLEFQLSKSSTASALIYGEAQAAESRTDFLHKMKMVLKEIRESKVNLPIINEKPIIKSQRVLEALNEANQLIALFLTSVATTKENIRKEHENAKKEKNLSKKVNITNSGDT